MWGEMDEDRAGIDWLSADLGEEHGEVKRRDVGFGTQLEEDNGVADGS